MNVPLTLIIIIGSIFSVFSQPVNPGDLAVYRDSVYPFSISYPKSWDRIEPAFPETRIKAIGEYSDFSVTVLQLKEAAGMSTQEFADSLVKSPELLKAIISKDIPNATVVSSGKTFLNNKPAVFIKGQGVNRTLDLTTKVTIYQVLLLADGDAYLLSFRTPSQDFDRVFNEFRLVATTFLIRPSHTKDESSRRTYTDDIFPFALTYPVDWSREESGSALIRLKLRNEYGTGAADLSIIAVRANKSATSTPSEIIDFLIKNPTYFLTAVRSGVADAELVTMKRDELNGKLALVSKYYGTHASANRPIKLSYLQFTIPLGEVTYTLTFRAPKNDFDTLAPSFDSMAKTFVVRTANKSKP